MKLPLLAALILATLLVMYFTASKRTVEYPDPVPSVTDPIRYTPVEESLNPKG